MTEKGINFQFAKRIILGAGRGKLFFRGKLDSRRLSKVFPELANYKRLVRSDVNYLKPAYDKYITYISTNDRAVSWETSCFLYIIATIRGARKILDLGSGFSSYVLRSYFMKIQSEALVYSVDDNDSWLEMTKSFLLDYRIPVDRLTTWAHFQQYNRSKFDLIFHDLGSMETRADSLPYVVGLLEEGGLIVLDDMHKEKYRRVVEREIWRAGLSLYSTRNYTLDEFDRFSEIAIGDLTTRSN